MKKKINQIHSEGRAQPEIRQGAWFADNAGSLVMVTEVTEYRISYVRYGFSSPCVCSPGRLSREFKPAAAPGSMEQSA